MTQYNMVHVRYYILEPTKTGKFVLRILTYLLTSPHKSYKSFRYNKFASLYLYLIVLIQLTADWKLANLNDYNMT